MARKFFRWCDEGVAVARAIVGEIVCAEETFVAVGEHDDAQGEPLMEVRGFTPAVPGCRPYRGLLGVRCLPSAYALG